MDACVLLESSSYTLRRVLGCFEIDTSVAMTFFSGFDFDFRFAFNFSCATLFDRISLPKFQPAVGGSYSGESKAHILRDRVQHCHLLLNLSSFAQSVVTKS